MYNLELAIENWRNELMAQESILPENIEEMEDHLRTSILHLVKQGLSEDEAFLIASKRLGASHNLNIEFNKVNTVALWFRRLRWMVIGILLFQAFSGIWILFTRASSEYLLVFSKSPISSGVLFIVLSAFLPAVVWLGLKNLTNVNSPLLNRLTIFSQLVTERQKVLAGWLAVVFLFMPIGEIMFARLATRNLSPQIFGEYSLIVSVYELVAGILIPVFGILVLLWLNRTLNQYTTTK